MKLFLSSNVVITVFLDFLFHLNESVIRNNEISITLEARSLLIKSIVIY